MHINLVISHISTAVLVSVSAQGSIVELGKVHKRSAPSLSSLPKVALKTVPIFVWLNTDRSRPWRVECRPLLFPTRLSFRHSAQEASTGNCTALSQSSHTNVMSPHNSGNGGGLGGWVGGGGGGEMSCISRAGIPETRKPTYFQCVQHLSIYGR